jgi:hypothetical protein
LKKRPFLLGPEFGNLFKIEPELMRRIYLKRYETERLWWLVPRCRASRKRS